MSYNTDSEWLTKEHVFDYLNRAENIPHRAEGEAVLLENIPANTTKRVLDLGTGNGRLLNLLNKHIPNIIEIVGTDVSPIMIKAAKERFACNPFVKIIEHDLNNPLSYAELIGQRSFDAIVSSFAIHHLTHHRKRSLYSEIFSLLNRNGIFCNLDHVSSPTSGLHERFMAKLGKTPETEDRSNKLLDVETQLEWLREVGFDDVDCYWKWLEFALLIGVKP